MTTLGKARRGLRSREAVLDRPNPHRSRRPGDRRRRGRPPRRAVPRRRSTSWCGRSRTARPADCSIDAGLEAGDVAGPGRRPGPRRRARAPARRRRLRHLRGVPGRGRGPAGQRHVPLRAAGLLQPGRARPTTWPPRAAPGARARRSSCPSPGSAPGPAAARSSTSMTGGGPAPVRHLAAGVPLRRRLRRGDEERRRRQRARALVLPDPDRHGRDRRHKQLANRFLPAP